MHINRSRPLESNIKLNKAKKDNMLNEDQSNRGSKWCIRKGDICKIKTIPQQAKPDGVARKERSGPVIA